MTVPENLQLDDARFMAAALALGRRGLGATSPNPSVGALIVKDGRVVGRGVTGPGGRPHGETIALAQAGVEAVGATIYVTLEPCSHHGRTGPCCEAIVAAGVGRLVYPMDDPNPIVAGAGAAYCRAHGVIVESGVGAEAARRDHRGHIRRVTRGQSAVTLKLAETADGFVAGGPHDPRLAITGAASNGVVHVLRAMHDAIMVGVGTVLADDPLMTVRLPGIGAKPTRIVLDAALRIPPQSRLLRTAAETPVLLLAAEAAARAGRLAGSEGVEVVIVPQLASGRLDLQAALALLAEKGINRIFSEGGPSVAASLIEAGLADDILVFTASRRLGGEGIPTFSSATRGMLADPRRFRLADERVFGADILRHYESVS